jgi:hypothetical protein
VAEETWKDPEKYKVVKNYAGTGNYLILIFRRKETKVN